MKKDHSSLASYTYGKHFPCAPCLFCSTRAHGRGMERQDQSAQWQYVPGPQVSNTDSYPIPHFILGAICHKETTLLIFLLFFSQRPKSELAVTCNSITHAGHCLLSLNKLYNPGSWHFNHINYSTKPLLRDLERWRGGNPLEASTV